MGKVSAYHVAYIEQTMTEESSDECIREDVHSVIDMLGDAIDNSLPNLPADHPIMHYLKENEEMKRLLLAVEDLVQYPMIKNQWLELYEKISQYPLHYKRKQNQLYPVLEQKGFARPTTTMWTFDDMVRDHMRECRRLLDAGDDDAFVAECEKLVYYGRDLMDKEETILYPTSCAMISEENLRNEGRRSRDWLRLSQYRGRPSQGGCRNGCSRCARRGFCRRSGAVALEIRLFDRRQRETRW